MSESTKSQIYELKLAALSYSKLKDYKKSIYHYEKNISIRPKSPIAYSNLGNVYKALGEYEKAVSWHQKAILINPQYSDAYYNLGNAYYKIGKYSESEKCLYQAISVKKDSDLSATHLIALFIF